VCVVLVGDLASRTLPPGCYTAGAAISLSAILTLDAIGAGDAKWTFTIDAAFSAAAESKIMLTDVGDSPAQIVEWNVAGAITLGAGVTVIGSMNAGGAIDVGAGATCDTLDAGGAISVGAGSTVIGSMTAVGAIGLGAHATCGDLDAGGAVVVGAHAKCGPITAGGAATVGAEARCGAITAVGAIDVGANAAVLYARTSAALTLGAGATMYLTVDDNKFILDAAVAERYNDGEPVEMKVRATRMSDGGADAKWLGSCDSFECTNVFDTGFLNSDVVNPSIISFDAIANTFTFDLFAAIMAHPNAIIFTPPFTPGPVTGFEGPTLNVKVINAPGSGPTSSEFTWYATGCGDTLAEGNCVDY
jgi:hypothetical protein